MTDTLKPEEPKPQRTLRGLVRDNAVRAAFVALLVAIGAYFGFVQP
jgi:hypothetical protein